jgi:type IV pilus assembly protein PilQ
MKSNQENQMTAKWRSRALALALFVGACAPAMAQNAIQSINTTQQAGSEVVRIELSEALTAVPAGFTIQTPPRIAIDLPGVSNGLGKPSVEVNQGNLRSVNVAQAGERTRLVLNLKKAASYRAELQGKVLLLILDGAAAPAATTAAAAASPEPVRFAESLNRNPLALKDIDFRRGSDGAASSSTCRTTRWVSTFANKARAWSSNSCARPCPTTCAAAST